MTKLDLEALAKDILADAAFNDNLRVGLSDLARGYIRAARQRDEALKALALIAEDDSHELDCSASDGCGCYQRLAGATLRILATEADRTSTERGVGR